MRVSTAMLLLMLKRSAVQITKVVIPPPKDGKARDYAFVHFADAAVVAKLIEDCDRGEKPQLEGAPLEVSSSGFMHGLT